MLHAALAHTTNAGAGAAVVLIIIPLHDPPTVFHVSTTTARHLHHYSKIYGCNAHTCAYQEVLRNGIQIPWKALCEIEGEGKVIAYA